MIENYPKEIKYLAERSDLLFGNLREFQKLSEVYDMNGIEELMQHLLKLPKDGRKIIICTNGAGSVLYSYSDGSSGPIESNEYRFEPVSSEKIVDTTGCGDAFVSGFFYGFLRRRSIKSCIQNGHDTASNKLRSIGGTI